jgi:hypothetical protein
MYSCHLQGSIIQRLNCLTLEDESATFLPNAETDQPTTLCHIPEDLNPQVHRRQDSQTLLIACGHYREVKLRYVQLVVEIIATQLAPYRTQENIRLFFPRHTRNFLENTSGKSTLSIPLD